MKILLLNWCDRKNPLGGGAEIHLEEIFSRIAARGHEVFLMCSAFKGCKKEEIVEGINIIRTGRRATFNFDAKRFYKKNFASEKFDLLVEDINKIPFYAPLWSRSPVLPVVPHLFGTTVFREAPLPLAFYVYLWEKPLLKVYAKLHFEVISESTKEDLVKRGFDRDKIHVVHCGIDHEIYKPGGQKSPDPLIVYVGRLKKYKRIDLPIKAVKKLKKSFDKLKLVIVGDGDASLNLKKLAEKTLDEDDYEFTGFITLAEKISWMRKAHVVVNTSEKEGWGLTGVEANACGTAVVASDSPGIRDSIIDNYSGILVKHGDICALASTLENILSDEEKRKKLEIGALERVKALTWEIAAEKTFALIEKILG
ncbi:glycosyltransferase family 4 protein [candidate division WOR-3 bacterium]|nr:glycosyltransferase family 4 protein [candidate division WOR-3 bacterium]